MGAFSFGFCNTNNQQAGTLLCSENVRITAFVLVECSSIFCAEVKKVYAILAPAKVNLVLEVGKRRPDGFHELATVFQSIDLADRLVIEEADTDIELELGGSQALDRHGVGQANLVWRAARLFASAIGRKSAGVRIRLEKSIPVAAGLGGGSSDAAATLLGLAQLWNVSDDDLITGLAAQLGSDVSFFLQRGSALGRGRGEILTPLQLPKVWLVLANPGLPTSTAEVYRALAMRRADEGGKCAFSVGERCAQLVEALNKGDLVAASHMLVNDLAEPALSVTPAIGPLLKLLRDAGALGAQVCGSGSTVFAVASDANHAEELAKQAQRSAAWTWWGCTTRK